MPAEIREHIRYPEDLFRVQTNVWARYQLERSSGILRAGQGVVRGPGSGRRHRCSDLAAITTPDGVVQQALAGGSHRPVLPTDAPAGRGRSGFRHPAAPSCRSPLRTPAGNSPPSWSARAIGDEYGELVAYKVEPLGLTDGPALVNSKIQSDPSISRVVTLLNQQGSRVEFGDLAARAGGELDPLCAAHVRRGTEPAGARSCNRCIAVLGERVVMCPTLERGAARSVRPNGLVSDSQEDASSSSCVGNTAGTGGGDCCRSRHVEPEPEPARRPRTEPQLAGSARDRSLRPLHRPPPARWVTCSIRRRGPIRRG